MASPIAQLNDKSWLIEQYIVHQKSDNDIATELGCCNATVNRWRGKHQIAARERSLAVRLGRPRKLVDVVCAQCGKMFQRTPSSIANSGRQFCNGQCYGAWRSEQHTGSNNSNWGGGPAACICAQCGDLFHRKRALLNRGKRNFCTRRCYWAWETEHSRGANNHAWKGGATTERGKWAQNGGRGWKRACRKRDAYTCQRCGEVLDKQSKRLHIHHKAPFAEYPELRCEEANGMCLCKKCHLWAHSNEGRLVRFRWEQEALAEMGHLLEPTAATAAN